MRINRHLISPMIFYHQSRTWNNLIYKRLPKLLVSATNNLKCKFFIYLLISHKIIMRFL